MMRVKLFIQAILLLFIIPCEWFNRFASGGIMGLPGPQLQSLSFLRESWKLFIGIVPISEKLTVDNGYMYNEVTYSDGSKLLFR